MYNQGYNVYTHTSHTDFSTDLSWDGQSLILWQQWRREGVEREGLEGGKTVIKFYSTHTHHLSLHSNNYTTNSRYIPTNSSYTIHTHNTHTNTNARHCIHILATSFPGPHTNIRERGWSYLRELCNACDYTHPLPTPSPCMTIHYWPGLCSPPQYNTLKTHQFLLGTVSLVAAFHCTHSPTRNGIHPVTLDHQNISSSNIKLCVHDN